MYGKAIRGNRFCEERGITSEPKLPMKIITYIMQQQGMTDQHGIQKTFPNTMEE